MDTRPDDWQMLSLLMAGIRDVVASDIWADYLAFKDKFPEYPLGEFSGVPPKVTRHLTGAGGSKMLNALERYASTRGFLVSLEKLPGKVNGYTDYAEGSIVVNSARPVPHQVKTLAHELGHVILHAEAQGDGDRGLKELEAEGVAYVVLKSAGIDSGDFSFGYIAVFSGGKCSDEIHEKVEASWPCIQQAADVLITALLTEVVMHERSA